MDDLTEIIITAAVSLILGGTGIGGLLFWAVRRSLEQAALKRENDLKKEREDQKKRFKCDRALYHAQGRIFFWLKKSIYDDFRNGELKQAFEDYDNAERARRELDADLLGDMESK